MSSKMKKGNEDSIPFETKFCWDETDVGPNGTPVTKDLILS